MSKLTFSPVIKKRENEHWPLTSNPVTPQGQAIVCPWEKCGKIFSAPIELTVRTKDSRQTYHACPHCFSRVNISDNHEKNPSEVSLGALGDASESITKNDAENCIHFLGYLKTRPKDSQIPDECLTCSKILKCM